MLFGLLVLVAWSGAQADTYYVRSDGSDGRSGDSHDKALRTLSFAMELVRDGDTIYLKSGDRFTPSSQLRISRDNITLGAYYVNSAGAAVPGVSGSRPVIDGQTNVPSRGSYSGLVHITGRDNVIRDLEVRNSGGTGVRFAETIGGTAINVKTDWSYFFGIQAFKSENIEIRDCEVVGFGRGGREFGEPTYPNGISVRTSHHVVVSGSIAREGWGEGINSYYGSSNVLFENNLVYAVRNIGIYVDSTHNATVRNNIVLGSSNSDYHRYGAGTSVGPGIVINNEDFQFEDFGGSLSLDRAARDVKIYNNLVAGTAAGFAIWGQHPQATVRNAVIAHNTFVDNGVQFWIANDKLLNVEVANNIFVSNGGNDDFKEPGKADPIRFVSNYWSQGRPNAALVGSGDVYSGLSLSKTSGWDRISSHTSIDWRDFLPMPGSKTIGAASRDIGVAPTGDYNGTPMNRPPDIGALANGTAGAASTSGTARPKAPVLQSID
jgi:hypothetical protein